MLERLWILTRLQLSNKTRIYEKNSKRIYAHIALQFLMIIIISVVVSLILFFIKDMLYIPVNDYFMIFVLIVTQLMSIVSALAGLVVDIFQSKDNQILLSFPAKNDEIFLSKLIVYYINEFIRNLYFLFPFLIGFGVITDMNALYYVSIIPMIIFLPFISVFFSAFLSIFITMIKNYLNRHPLIIFFLSILLIFGIFYFVFQLVSLIPDNIRIVQLYNSFIISLTRFMQKVASFGLIYTTIGKLLYGTNVIVNYLIVIVTVIILFVLNYLISRPLFFVLTSKTSETAVEKKHHFHDPKKPGLFWTFLRKEWTIAKRSPNEMLNNYIILVFLPLIMYLLNTIYMGMARSTIGNQFVLIFNVLITLMIVTASNTGSAVAITTEGYEFVLLKTAPSNTRQVAWAKMTFNFIFSSVLILLSFILFQLALPVFNTHDIWLLFAFVFIFNASHILWSFQIDIMSPKLSDYAATGSLSNNENIAKSLKYGLVLTFVLTGISAIFFVFAESIAWYVLIGIALVWLIFRFYMFRSYLNAYFVDIEY